MYKRPPWTHFYKMIVYSSYDENNTFFKKILTASEVEENNEFKK